MIGLKTSRYSVSDENTNSLMVNKDIVIAIMLPTEFSKNLFNDDLS